MVRSLYSGISGLRTHQVGLDVTANNIANVNTVAFKSGRATFKESMVQMLQGPSRPAGNQGGTNPMQLGLGVAVGSIDTMLRQGNLQTTGQITDLALEGRAYFAFSSGNAVFYSRNGGLQMDAEGRLVSPTNGYRLQGKMAGADGTFSPNSMIGDIRIPWGDKAPAKATDLIALSCNLNSDSHALGTVTHTNRFLASAGAVAGAGLDSELMAGRAKLSDLFDENGNSLGIKLGDTLTFRVADPNIPTFKWTVEKSQVDIFDNPDNRYMPPALPGNQDPIGAEMREPTLQDLVEQLQAYLQEITGSTDVTIAIDPATGGLTVTNGSSNNITGLQISSSRPGSNSFVANAFLFPSNIRAANATDGPGVYTSPSIRIPAVADDALANLFDASGRPLGFTDGDTININGMVGGRNKNVELLYYDGVGTNPFSPTAQAGRTGQPTTMEDLLLALQEAFGLPTTDGTIYNRESVYIKDSSDLVADGVPVGAIVLRGQPELAFALTGISVMGKQNDPNQADSPTRFNTNMTFTEVQSARNTGVWPTSQIIYDDSGAQHNVTMTFTHTGIPGEWLWEISMVGSDAVILGGNRGRVTFGVDGSPSSFTFDDFSNEFRFDPRNGASEVAIRIDAGTAGSLLGITQFESDSTTAISHQNGYPMGKLQEITINDFGEISGIYTNGISKTIAQIYVAEFNNPAGLLKMGDSMFGVSNNSGTPAMYQPGVGSTTKVKPGALEMSNVELETEFTNMITIQRGYQASARVISTSDQMLQELVQLVR
ncbi:MAG: flagellar hook-basal body complex protein [Chitinispirillales bacterium]|jgi:flagellar hook protein FlgE|nr:flagellar hook-basal body complex protein [Chitinispirillales bacterium]